MAPDDVITAVIEDVAGLDVLPLIGVLKGRKNVSEFTIAEELKEEINTIRNKLYRLYDSNLVEFTRKKDKKKGWYIYYWTFVPSRIPFLVKDLKKKKLQKLADRLKTEQGSNFFECPNKDMRLTFEKAVDHDFKCPECGSLMHQEDNEKKIQHITDEIQKLEREISSHVDFVYPSIAIDVAEEIAKAKIVKKVEVKVVKKAIKKNKRK